MRLPLTLLLAVLGAGAWLGVGRAAAAEVEGAVQRISRAERAFVVRDEQDGWWLFVAAPDVRLRLMGEEEPFENLAEEWRVKVGYEKQGGRLVARTIDASPVLFQKAEDDEHALVRIFYATNRNANTGLTLDWRWYARHFSAAGAAAGATLLLARAARRKQSRRWRWLAAVALLGTMALAGLAVSRWVHLSGGAVAPDQLYGSERSDRLQLGTAAVSIPRDHKLGTLETPSILRFEFVYDPAKHVMLQEIEPRLPDDFYAALQANVEKSSRRELFVFTHGYNTTFQEAARRTAQLAYDLEFDGVPVLFSWPSQGKLLQYTVDESNVEWAVHDLKQFLRDLAARSGARTIHLVAHSMGNRALTGALLALAVEPGYDKERFSHVVLAAPDIDAATFQRDIAPAVQKAAGRVTLYASSKDEALALSKQVHGYARAGESGDKLVVLPGLDTIDVSTVDTSMVGHTYYGDNRSLLADIYALVNKGLPPVQRVRLRPAQRHGLPYWIFQPAAEPEL